MIFERIGFFFLSKIQISFLFILTGLPLLFAGMYVLHEQLELSSLQAEYETTLIRAYKSLNQRIGKDRFLSRYSLAEPYFLDQHIESTLLLQDEIEWLSAYEHHPALAETKLAEQRLNHLTKGKNRISFTEEGIKKSSFCQEVEEKMKKSVEMNEKDLKKILAIIENLQIDSYEPHPKSPQMIITNFYLKRKNSPFKQEIFEVKLDLLKREFKKT